MIATRNIADSYQIVSGGKEHMIGNENDEVPNDAPSQATIRRHLIYRGVPVIPVYCRTRYC